MRSVGLTIASDYTNSQPEGWAAASEMCIYRLLSPVAALSYRLGSC